jgi:K+-sensing histidine kinase KdpD
MIMSDLVTKVTASGFGVAVCLVVDIALDAADIKTPYLAFMPAIVGACALGGLSAALWATFFSSLGLLYFFIPPSGFALPNFSDLAHLLVFVGVSLFVCWVIDSQRRSNHELSRDNVILGCKISTLLARTKSS